MHTDTCKCRSCYGLREFMLNETGKDYGLPETRIDILTFGPPPSAEDPCDATMLCPCPQCANERARRVNTGIRPDASNPFKTRAA